MNHEFAQTLLAWYDRHHRRLPWRTDPATHERGHRPDPYRVWLSEIMLQQTTVPAVKPYFESFVQRWPTVNDLAAADEDDVLKAWAGLGYYSRARNLKRCADRVASTFDGRFPETTEALKQLPGIGDYTAAAVSAIAFGRHCAVVDGNVERVVARLHRIATPLPSAKPAIRRLTLDLTPVERSGDFAQAMMDLGATICSPKRPACTLCPVNTHCLAVGQSDAELYPVKPPKGERPVRRGAAFVAVSGDGAVFLRKRPGRGLLAGMSEVPTTAWNARQDGETGPDAAPFDAPWTPAGTVRHVFTHFELHLVIYRAETGEASGDGWWSTPDEIEGEALPTVMKKAIAAAIGS